VGAAGRPLPRGLAWLRAPCAILWGALLVGCFAGYDFVSYENALGDVRTVAIEALRNGSLHEGVDSIVSDAITTEFRRRRALRVVEDPEIADLIIGGQVAEVRVAARTFSSIQFALEYSITLQLDVMVRRPDGTEVPIGDRALSGTDLYFASADIEATRKNQSEAVRRVAVVLAGRLHDALFQRTIQ
jgi:hypothetical protein